MSINYSPELVTDGAVFVGDARTSSTATAGSRLYDKAGIDSADVKLLIHGNVGSGQSFTDSSLSNHTITANGDVTHSTTQSKFSGGSIYFDGSGDYLTIPAIGDWDVGTGNWTLDCWAYTTLGTSYSYLFDTRSGSYTSNFSIYRNGLSLVYYAQVSALITATTVLSLNTWHHIALVRSGSTVTMYVDGVSVGSATDANDYQGLAPFTIGTRYSIDGFWQGYQDEFRFTKGVALWTQNFTPPARRDTLSISDGMMYNGSCLNFDGTDEEVVTSGYFGALAGDDDVTLCAWINVDTTADMGIVTVGNVYIGIIVSGGYLEARCYDGSAQLTNTDAHKITPNQWCHVAGVFSGGNVTLYKDGVATAAVACSNQSIPENSTYFQLGQAYNASVPIWMNGQMSNATAFNTALSASQIKEIYQDSKVIIPSNVSQTNLKGFWTCAEGAGDICYDGSGRGIAGDFSNMEAADWLTGQTGCPQLVEGYNRPFLFDADGYVDTSLTMDALTDYTFSWWSRSTSQDNRALFSSGTNNSTGAFHQNWYGTTNKPILYLAGNNYSYFVDTPAQDDGQWHHWLLTYKGTATSDEQAKDSSLFIDGVLISHSSIADSQAPATWGTFRIGHLGGGGTWSGNLNEFIIYNGELSSSERAALYVTGPNGGPLPPDPMSLSNSSDIVAYWRNDSNTTWKNRGPQVVKNFTDVATDPINDSNAVGGWTNNGTSLTSVVGGRTGFIDGAMRVAPRYRFLFDSAINCTVNSVIAVTSGKTYKLSAWFMGGTSTTARLIATGGYYDSGNFTAASTSWTNKTSTFKATSTGDLTIELHNRAAGTMYFDDVTLVESGPALDGTVGGSPDTLLFKQGYNGRLSTSTGRDGQGFPLLNKDVGAIGFDGTSTYIEVPASNGGELDITENITLAAWCFAESKSSWRRVIARRATTSSALPYMLGLNDSTDQKWNFYIDGSSGATSLNSSGPASINTWVYVVGVLRGTAMELYLNGELDNSTTHSGGLDAGGADPNVQIGSQLMPDTTGYVWDGQIANVKIYNRGLSQAEITQNYNAQRSRFT